MFGKYFNINRSPHVCTIALQDHPMPTTVSTGLRESEDSNGVYFCLDRWPPPVSVGMSCPTTCDPTSKPKVLISTYLGRKISGPVGLVTTLAIIGYFEVNKQDSCLAKKKTK
jgi:hypothetical protein